MLIKPLQITSNISSITTCQSFFSFPVKMILVSWSTVSVCVQCVCMHMGTWELTGNLFQLAGYGFYFCLLYPLSYAFSLKVESNLSQLPGLARTKRRWKHTQICPVGGTFEFAGFKTELPY